MLIDRDTIRSIGSCAIVRKRLSSLPTNGYLNEPRPAPFSFIFGLITTKQ